MRSGQIGRAPKFYFEDGTYEPHLEDRSIGLKKGIIYLSGADRVPIFEVPVVWHRLPFLLADTPPGVIDGTIEVRTTAQGRPPLRIPVVRYAPVASR